MLIAKLFVCVVFTSDVVYQRYKIDLPVNSVCSYYVCKKILDNDHLLRLETSIAARFLGTADRWEKILNYAEVLSKPPLN